LPTCTEVNGQWSVSYGQDFGGGGEGIPSGFIALAVLVFLIGGGLAVWRVSMARQMATNAGLNPGQATAVTLLGSPGLDAAYLAAKLAAAVRESNRGGDTGTHGRATSGRAAASPRSGPRDG
jgi:hypothetical protein